MRGFIDALGVAGYVILFAWVINNLEHWFGDVPDTWLAPVLMLLVFIISACVTSLSPFCFMWKGRKKNPSVYSSLP